MLSKRNVKLRAKTKVVQQRRQWLSKALDNAKECYNETLSVFKLRLDDIVSAPLENAEKLLEEPNEDVFISKVFNAATAIEKCTDELLQLNMQLYETFESDYDDDAESETLERFIENSQVQCSDPKESLNGEATKKNDSDTACLDISMNNGSLREKYEHLSSNNPHDKSSSSLPETRTELLACADFQKIFPTSSVDSPQVSSKATDINNGPSLNQYNEPWPYDETNFLLHHNIKYEQKVSVVISDISSPGLFSVHSEIGREKLMILQKDLNEMYSKASTEKLKFKDSPVADTLCVSLFPVDKVWYRAIILSLIDSNKCEVVYVDYGNQAVVTNDSIRQIVPEFADTPPLSIFCCLSGIQPSHNNNHSNDTDDNKEWSTECMDWFCSYGLENSFVAVFLRSDSDGGSTVGGCGFSVNLFEASTSSNGQVILNSVAAKLVSLGYARYTEIQSTIASNHFHSPSCGNGVEKIEMSASSSFDDTKRPQLKSDLDVKAENFAPETPEEPTSTDTAVILPCEEQHLDESPQETSAKPCSVSSIPVTSANTDKSEDDQSDTLSMHASDLMFSSTTDSTTSTLQPSSKSTISLVKPALPGQQESSVDLLEDESKAECGVAEESERLSPGPTKDQLVTDNNEHNSSFEYDLVLLLNIEYDQIVPVEISDVRSPGRFSVQSETGSEQLIQLQRLLNEMGSNQMEMVNDPEVGTICAALFLQDSRWYRAKILSVLGNDEFKVCYIDYGNSDVLHKKHLRILDASYAEFVPLSISCSLFGVEPNTSGSSEGPKQWSDSSINWFNTYVVGKKFSAQFLKNSGGNVYEVNLFHVSTSADNHENLWDVSQTLVFLGHAIFCDKLKKVSDNFSHVLPCIVDEKTSSPTSNGSVIISPETENKSVLESNQSFYLSSRNDTSSPLHSTPVIVEDTLRGISPVSCPVNVPTTCTSSLSCNSYPLNAQLSQSGQLVSRPSSLSNMEFLEQQNLACYNIFKDRTSKAMEAWDPMAEDYTSNRNCYEVDTENACVAVEQFNPEKSERCKYFDRGDCWKGKNCPRPHIDDADVLYQTEVLSMHTLGEIELNPGYIVMVKITTVPKNGDFYAQIAGRKKCDTDEMEHFSPELNVLTSDMKRYYSKNRLRCSDELTCGALYTVVHEQTFCRATVIKKAEGSPKFQIHLIDYGTKMWVCPERLMPFCKVFMHLPPQAVLCTIDDNLTSLKPVRSHAYLARVGEFMSVVDGPVSLTFIQELC